MDPCGTIAWILAQDEHGPSKTTHCFLSLRKSSKIFCLREELCQQIVMECEWHTLNSIAEALNLLREYETNSITKFSCYSSDKGFGKIGKFNIWMGEKGVIFQKNPIIKRSLKNGCSKNLEKLWGNKQSKRSFLAKLHAKSGGYLNDRGS